MWNKFKNFSTFKFFIIYGVVLTLVVIILVTNIFVEHINLLIGSGVVFGITSALLIVKVFTSSDI
jgi:hypothetical protein